MGIENLGKMPVSQGDAGFLTQEQLDEMNEVTAPVTEVTPTNASPEVFEDSSWVNLAAGEQTPTPALSPERRAEVMEQIGNEEARLGSNLAENESALAAAEAKSSNPAIATEAPLKALLARAQIAEAYDKAKSKINKLAVLGGTVGLGILASSMFASMQSEHLRSAWEFAGADRWNEIGTKLAEGGLGAAAVVGGVWALSRTMNWMKKKASERKIDSMQGTQTA